MTPHLLPSPTRGLLVGLDVLLVVLVVVAVAQAPGSLVLVTLVGAVLLAVYAGGRATVRVADRPLDAPRGRWWPDAAWIVALSGAWLVLLWLTPTGLWVAFPLMLLQMHVLGPHRGTVAVAVTTAVTVAEGLLVQLDDGAWLGFVLGPVLGGAVAVGVVLGIEAFVRESQNRQRTHDELTQARERLAVADRDSAVATERERLARDIHDTIAQSLSAIELLLRTADGAIGADDARAHALVDQARDAARDSLAEARRFVRDLTPADLDQATLVGAVHRVAERVGASGPGALTVAVHTHGEPRRLPVATETALLRIAQSALANVVQHAGATHADVTLAYTDGAVSITVADDGAGFDPGATSPGRVDGGFGLPAIRSRALELGGTLAVESRPGEGTVLTVVVPAHVSTPTASPAEGRA